MPRGRTKNGVPYKRLKAGTLPDEIRTVEAAQGRCPGGHALPNRTNKGRCTPVYCPVFKGGSPVVEKRTNAGRDKIALSEIGKKGRKKQLADKETLATLSTEADKVIEEMIPGDSPGMVAAREEAKRFKMEHLTKLAQSVGRWSAMKAFFKVPENLEGAAAEEFVQRRALSLSVDAIMVLEKQLKLGDSAEQREAVRDILDMNGMRKRESGTAGGAVIMLINPNGTGPIPSPFAQRIPISSVVTKELPRGTTEKEAVAVVAGPPVLAGGS